VEIIAKTDCEEPPAKEEMDRMEAAAALDDDLDYPDNLTEAPEGEELLIYPVRIPADRVGQLVRVARQRGVKPSELMRDFTLLLLDVNSPRG
jgi:hypothetical protein